MVKITHEKWKCIGCGACASICPKYWKLMPDGKSKLIGSKKSGSKELYELEVKTIDCNKKAADACPVNCIHIK